VNDWPAGEHLASIYDALYISLGEGAGRVTVDAYVLRMHYASRTFGALALELRADHDVVADPVVSDAFARSLDVDDSGVLTLYVLAMVVGPRLLVTLRDYLVDETSEARRDILGRGSDDVVREIRAVGAALADAQAPGDEWAHAARDIVEGFDAAGMAESLGQRP
jgi:hypothetical protein